MAITRLGLTGPMAAYRGFSPKAPFLGTVDAYLQDFIEVRAVDRVFGVDAEGRWFRVPPIGREFDV